jgi:hypothetical protein
VEVEVCDATVALALVGPEWKSGSPNFRAGVNRSSPFEASATAAPPPRQPITVLECLRYTVQRMWTEKVMEANFLNLNNSTAEAQITMLSQSQQMRDLNVASSIQAKDYSEFHTS